jgi:hypothetical protein
MSDEINANVEPTLGDVTPPAPQVETVQLSREEYGQLTAQLAVAQAQIERMAASLENKPEPQAPNPLAGKDINTMTNSELIDFMSNNVNQQVAQPLLNTIMQLAIKEELRDVAERYPDFKDFKKETYAIAEKNTHLSIEQAYLLAKAGKPAPAPPTTPVVKAAPPVGDKPQVTASSVAGDSRLTARQAAEAALKSLKYT